VGVPADDLRRCGADLPARPPDLQFRQVKGVEDELDLAAGEKRVH
jgi:hypothetical protein